MNFIEQMRGFWLLSDILKQHGIKIKSSHNSLYFALFRMANESGWEPWVTVTKKQALDYSGLSINTYYNNLYELESWGLVKIKNKGDRHKPIKIKLLICISKMIHDHEDRISKMIHAYIKNDTRLRNSYIKFDTILKHKNKLLKQEGGISSISGKKNGEVKKPIVIPRSQQPKRKDLQPLL